MSARRAGSFLRAGLCGASLLVMGRADVCAATVVGLANSAGIAGGLASWGAINGWFAHLAAATLPVVSTSATSATLPSMFRLRASSGYCGLTSTSITRSSDWITGALR